MKGLKKFWVLFEDVTAGTFFMAGISLIFYGVLMRYVFDEPKSWVEEVARYSLVWGSLLGISIALRQNQHIQVDMLYDRLPKPIQRGVNLFANCMGILFCLFYTWYGYILVSKRMTSGMVSLDVGIPMWIVYLILPISGIMFLLRFIERLVAVAKGEEEGHDAAGV